MILALHALLQRLLYQRGGIDPREVDILFEAPTRDRIDRLTRPTINLFLIDLRENLELRQNAFQTQQQNGRVERRLLPRRFDLHYMISALTTHSDDEHLLLWRILATLIQYPQLPEELLTEEFRSLEPPLSTRIVSADEQHNHLSIWSALGGPLHPVLHYVVTVPIEMQLAREAPLVLSHSIRYDRKDLPTNAAEARHHIGGMVHDTAGLPLQGAVVSVEGSPAASSVTDEEGRFALQNVPAGSLTLRIVSTDGVEKSVVMQVPKNGTTELLKEEHYRSHIIVLETASSVEA